MPADLALTVKLSATDSGTTVALNTSPTEELADPIMMFADIITTSTTATNIAIGSGVTWSNISFLGVKNLSETTGENIDLVKSTVVFATLKPGQAALIPCKADGTAIQWDAATGTPRLQVVAYGPIS